MIALAGMGVAWGMGFLAGGFKPRIAWGRTVAGAVSVNYEAFSPGKRIGDDNAFFRFENDVYGRAFEQANRWIGEPQPVRALPLPGAVGQLAIPVCRRFNCTAAIVPAFTPGSAAPRGGVVERNVSHARRR